MKIPTSWLLAPVAALLLVGLAPGEASAQYSFNTVRIIPCSYCSLPGTWTLFAPVTATSGGTAKSIYTFSSDGTVIASDPLGGGSYHGAWQRVDFFRYSMSAVRKTADGWERVRVVFAHKSCDDMRGQQKYDTLTCPGGVGPAGNASCDPEGTGWVNQDNTDANPTEIRFDRYARYPISYNAQ
jgi:hypothetical protein